MYNPIATYRLQFHQEFTFTNFEKIIDYLQKLGVKTVYASPVFKSVPGSTHGYDGIDPHQINPEIGNEKQLIAISKRLKGKNIGWLQDIVPNHMGVDAGNPWLMDVLEKGRRSAFSKFFDTGLATDFFADERIMMPSLGSSLQEVINNDELKIAYQNKQLVFKYYDNYWPLNPASYLTVLSQGGDHPVSQAIAKQIRSIDKAGDLSAFKSKWETWRNNLPKNTEAVDYLEKAIEIVNSDHALLLQIADSQYYRLCSWQKTDKQINYRRFFTVNTLMCLNIQDKDVFAAYHSLIKKMVDNGTFQGLRIDHIDGLYDPEAYLHQLKELTGDTYIVAEKILEEGEDLPVKWPLQGTTGYDYLAQVNNLLTDSSSEKKFKSYYQSLVGRQEPVERQILQKKAYILSAHMQGELSNLLNYLLKLKLVNDRGLKQVGRDNLKKAIGNMLIYCPVYRFYGNRLPVNDTEAQNLRKIFYTIIKDQKELKPALDLLDFVLIQKPLEGDSRYNSRALKFYQRLMQFSGPLMAKGVEDTLMYTYNCFVSHNEVGDAPDAFGIDVKDYHKLMKQRQKQWPLALNATSTHDTKRGEDVRARLNVLSSIPETWFGLVNEWERSVPNNNVPDANDRYFIYQTIVGAHPMPGQPDDNFAQRLNDYLTKALREGKTNSDWAKPDEDYEKATLAFAGSLLNEQSSFWQTLNRYYAFITDNGVINSLVQTLLKFTSPGIPDVYQGCELWDLSLVDPDNRRPVDYENRSRLLNTSLPDASEAMFDQLWQNRYSGHIKLWLTHELFKLRYSQQKLFAKGDYLPLKVKGAYKDNVIAFARRYQNKWLVIAAPLYTAAISQTQQTEVTAIDWKDTRIILPAEAPEQWQHIIAGTADKVKDNELLIAEIFSPAPFAILLLEHPENDRGSGVLMHITSLPSSFGIGDMGPGAKTFANFLNEAGQKYWQLLPLNPTGADQNYSPYSSVCSMAGNPLLISPVLLAKDGLIQENDLDKYHLPQTSTVDYLKVEQLKLELFEQAWHNFNIGSFPLLQADFEDFCDKENAWLNDFALYSVLKQHYNQAWYQWPKDFKNRNQESLGRFARLHGASINQVKWLQFIFYRQWHQLKAYCDTLNIKLFGDLPFYVSYDSADVWANQGFFALDKQGSMTGVAGVPPDYFSADGQLWGMPVYRWEALKQAGYSWWINRLQKNMELFDLLRLDHFRAFASFWQVPAGETTARNGRWVQGPGADFFNAVKQALGKLPFVSEDLGDIDAPVFMLRDEFNLPGMKVLQFAFGNETAQSLYIPHNYSPNFFVYTGTHDNNTAVGWYNQDATAAVKKQVEEYTGIETRQKNISKVLTRMAYSSTARVAITPMQDILGLDERSRMNNPSLPDHNWTWRMLPKLVSKDTAGDMLRLVKMYNRQ